MWRAPPSIDCEEENGSATPYACATACISCITPCAPLGERAPASKPLSACAIARNHASSTPVRLDAARNCAAYTSSRGLPSSPSPTCAYEPGGALSRRGAATSDQPGIGRVL